MQRNRHIKILLVLLAFASINSQSILDSDIVYEPSSAGILYPRDMKDLSGQIESFIKQSHKCRAGEYPNILIVPGASYLYIGGLLADAYTQVRGISYDAVIIIAPSADENLDGVAIFPGLYYRSLLGALQANESIVSNILAQDNNFIRLSQSGFRGNKFIDVQLPFIQYVFGNRDIVTLCVGRLDHDKIESIANSITKANMGKNVLYIIASNGKNTTSIKDMNLYNRSVCRKIKSCNTFQIDVKGSEVFQLQDNELVLQLGMEIAENINANSAEVYRINNATGLSKDRQTYETYISAGLYVSDNEIDIENLDLTEKEVNIIVDYVLSSLKTRVTQKAKLVKLPEYLAKRRFGIYMKISRDKKLITNGAELFSNQTLEQSIESVLNYIIFSDPVVGALNIEKLKGVNIEIVITGRGRRFLPGDSYPEDGLVYLKYDNYSSLNYIDEDSKAGEKVLRDLCLKAGLLYDCWQDEAAIVYIFDTVSRKRRFN
ncbi:MAG: AmmeMemoRadiSam system protein B [Candidatus Zixiibacteriota bacterium]